MIARIRKGNDFQHVWAITWNGQPEDFSDATDITLTVKVYGQVKTLTEGVDYVIDGNLVTIDFTPTICDITGTYTVELNYIKPSAEFVDGDRRSAVDVQAFQIVNTSAEANATEGVSLTSEALAIYALKYEDLSPENIAELQRPATDAAASVSALEQTVSDNEALRVTAEQGRVDAELLRVGAESARSDAEGLRNANEIARIEAEGIRDANETDRINAESDRVDAEDLRDQAEVAREEAEGLRQTNTTTAIQNANDAATAANTAAGNANDAATAANTAAGNANDATTAANTAADNANEMSSHPPVIINDYWHNWNFTTNQYETTGQYARGDSAIEGSLVLQTTGQSAVDVMSQKAVTDEIAQLAGDVNELELKDVVQSDKIKDIENVLSTANLGQSAQLSVSGRKTISLPKNAANGGMQVKLEGLTAENLVENGDFRNGTTGWSSAGYSTTSVENNELTTIITAMSVANRVQKQIPAVAGNKYYVRGEINPKYNNSTLFYDSGVSSDPLPVVPSIWNVISAILTASNDFQFRLHHRTDTNYAVGDAIKYRNMLSIDLTATFGAGNEPDLATCDAMFSDYFEGVASVNATGRFKAVGKNLFNGKFFNKVITSIGAVVDNPYALSTDFIGALPSRAYRFSFYSAFSLTPTELHMIEYDINKQFIQRQGGIYGSTSGTKTTTAKTRFIIIYADKLRGTGIPVGLNDATLQVEYGTVSTTFEAYKDSNLFLNAGQLRSTPTAKDEIRKGSNGYELVKRVGVGTIGAEVITNAADREFSSDTGFWTKQGETAIANSVATFTGLGSPVSTSGNHNLYKSGVLKENTPYKFTLKARTLEQPSGELYYGARYKGRTIIVSNTAQIYIGYIFSGSIASTNIGISVGGQLGVKFEIDSISVEEVVTPEGLAEYDKYNFRESDINIIYNLATPVITPISYGGILNSAESGTVYHEPVIADAGVYDTKIDVLLTDYPISAIEEVIKYENGINTYLDVSKAVVAGDGLSFTHPDLASGDLVLFTYAFDKESTNGNITATFYDSNVVKIDTATGKAYKIEDVITDGVLTRTLTEV